MGRRKIFTDEQETAILEWYFANGESRTKTARHFGTSKYLVDGLLNRKGIEPKAPTPGTGIDEETKQKILADWENGVQAYEICRRYGVSFYSMRNCVRREKAKRKVKAERNANVEACPPQLCWKCAKAVGGCNWSNRLEPVEGWTAKVVPRLNQDGSTGENYCITKCPEFVRD